MRRTTDTPTCPAWRGRPHCRGESSRHCGHALALGRWFRSHGIALQPTTHVIVIVLLAQQQAGEGLPLDASCVFGQAAGSQRVSRIRRFVDPGIEDRLEIRRVKVPACASAPFVRRRRMLAVAPGWQRPVCIGPRLCCRRDQDLPPPSAIHDICHESRPWNSAAHFSSSYRRLDSFRFR